MMIYDEEMYWWTAILRWYGFMRYSVFRTFLLLWKNLDLYFIWFVCGEGRTVSSSLLMWCSMEWRPFTGPRGMVIPLLGRCFWKEGHTSTSWIM